VTYARGLDLSGTLQGAGGIGGLLARYRHGTGSPYMVNGASFYHADGNGNVTYLANSTGGADAAYRYDPFGRWLAGTGSYASANVMRFSSKPWVAHNGSSTDGLYYYGYRFYDLSLQRWLNRDPIEELGGLNLYNYIANNPICDVDPLGLHPVAELLAAIAAEDAAAIELILSTYGESGMLSQAMMQAGRQALANITRKKALEQLAKQCKRLSESELKKHWKDKIHDIKKEIQKQFRDEMKRYGFGSSFDIGIDPAGNIVIIDKKTGAVIPTGTKPTDWLP
jgi:RHS repeat-associated protein